MTTNERPTDRLISTEDEYYAEMEAIHNGTATELFRCPVDDSLQGVASVKHVRPTSHLAFDGGDVITLNCGHVVI